MSYREETRRKGRRAIPRGIWGTLEGLNRSAVPLEERTSPFPRSKASSRSTENLKSPRPDKIIMYIPDMYARGNLFFNLRIIFRIVKIFETGQCFSYISVITCNYSEIQIQWQYVFIRYYILLVIIIINRVKIVVNLIINLY